MTSEQPFKIAVSDNALAILKRKLDDIRLLDKVRTMNYINREGQTRTLFAISSDVTTLSPSHSQTTLRLILSSNMNPPKAFPYTNEELDTAGLRGEGEGVSESVVQAMKTMTEHPELLDLSLFTLECMNYSGHRKSPSSPASPTLSEASSYLSALAVASDATAVAPYVLSDWERTTYYNGISPDPPELLYRSDLLKNPFPIPEGRHPHLPTRSVYGVFNTPLNAVWDTVAPRICEFLNARKIHYSAIKAARFVTHGEDGMDTLGPVVI